jgi:hypothetical protein
MGTFARSHYVPDLGAFSMMKGAKDKGYELIALWCK